MFFVPNVHGWEFGGFVPGDVYVYDICDYRTINRDISRLHLCYTLQLLILDTGISGSNTVWIAQTIITNSSSIGSDISLDYTQSHIQNDVLDHMMDNMPGDIGDIGDMMGDIILIDDTTYDVRSLSSRYVADTLSNTLFWIYHDARISSLDPRLGDDIPANHLYSPVIIDEYTEFDIAEFRVSFDGELISGHLQFQDDIGLPVSGVMYIPQTIQDRQLFTFDLVSLTRGIDISDSIPIFDDTSVIDSIFDGTFNDLDDNNDITDDITDTTNEIGTDIVSLISNDTLDNNTLDVSDDSLSNVSLDMISSDELSTISEETLPNGTTDVLVVIDTMNDVTNVSSNTLILVDDITDTLNDTSRGSNPQDNESQTEPDLIESLIGLIQDFVSDLQNAFRSAPVP